MTCHVCKKPLPDLSQCVGLNGRYTHVDCFSRALSKTVKPMKDAMKKAGLKA